MAEATLAQPASKSERSEAYPEAAIRFNLHRAVTVRRSRLQLTSVRSSVGAITDPYVYPQDHTHNIYCSALPQQHCKLLGAQCESVDMRSVGQPERLSGGS